MTCRALTISLVVCKGLKINFGKKTDTFELGYTVSVIARIWIQCPKLCISLLLVDKLTGNDALTDISLTGEPASTSPLRLWSVRRTWADSLTVVPTDILFHGHPRSLPRTLVAISFDDLLISIDYPVTRGHSLKLKTSHFVYDSAEFFTYRVEKYSENLPMIWLCQIHEHNSRTSLEVMFE